MQDYPKLLESCSRVGFTSLPTWYCFTPAKNNLKDGAACVEKGLPAFTASSAEWDLYEWHSKMLERANVQIQRETNITEFGGIKFAFGPKIFFHPSFALTFVDIKEKFPEGSKIGKDATLILGGKNTQVEKMDLNAALKVLDDGTKVNSDAASGRIDLVQVDPSDPESFQIRGYKASSSA